MVQVEMAARSRMVVARVSTSREPRPDLVESWQHFERERRAKD